MTSTHLSISALRATVRVDLPADVPLEVVERVRTAWSGAIAADDAAPDGLIEYESVGDVDRFLSGLSTAVTLEALEYEAGKAVLLHAGGIAMPDGRVIAFVGPSGRGKTTLIRALAQSHGYVSDESVAIDTDLRVYPYRKPLSIVREGHPKDQLSPRQAGLADLPDLALTLASVALIERDGHVGPPTIEHLHFADAVMLLVAQSSYLSELPGTVVTLARVCDAIGGIRCVRFTDAADVADVLDDLLAPGPPPEQWEARILPIITDDGSASTADAVDYGDVMIALSGRTIRVLEGIAPAVMRAVLEGASDVDAVVGAVVDQYGPPPEGSPVAQVTAVLSELADAGFVVPTPAGHGPACASGISPSVSM